MEGPLLPADLPWLTELGAARAALSRGFTHARTSNHVSNAPMLAVSEKVGFVREAATVILKKGVAEGQSPPSAHSSTTS